MLARSNTALERHSSLAMSRKGRNCMALIHIWSDKFSKGAGNPKFCRAAVHDEGRWPSFHQCSRKPKVFRAVEGRDGTFGFCGVHDPEVVEKKNKTKLEACRRDIEASHKKYLFDALTKKALEACKAAIEQILRQHIGIDFQKT